MFLLLLRAASQLDRLNALAAVPRKLRDRDLLVKLRGATDQLNCTGPSLSSSRRSAQVVGFFSLASMGFVNFPGRGARGLERGRGSLLLLADRPGDVGQAAPAPGQFSPLSFKPCRASAAGGACRRQRAMGSRLRAQHAWQRHRNHHWAAGNLFARLISNGREPNLGPPYLPVVRCAHRMSPGSRSAGRAIIKHVGAAIEGRRHEDCPSRVWPRCSRAIYRLSHIHDAVGAVPAGQAWWRQSAAALPAPSNKVELGAAGQVARIADWHDLGASAAKG